MLPQEEIRLGTNRNVIRELFEFGKLRAAEVGPENVFDFSIGNPSVPSPQCVTDAAKELLEGDPIALHGYTSAQGDATVRTVIAEHLNQRYHTSYRPENLYMTVGVTAALCCCFHGLTCPEDEFICFAPYFPEYEVFIRGAGRRWCASRPRSKRSKSTLTPLKRLSMSTPRAWWSTRPTTPAARSTRRKR